MTTPHLPPIPEPPRPTEFKLTVSYSTDTYGFFMDATEAAALTCTVCGDVIVDRYGLPPMGTDHDAVMKWAGTRVTRHQAMKHRELLYVYTSAGWMKAGDIGTTP